MGEVCGVGDGGKYTGITNTRFSGGRGVSASRDLPEGCG